VRRDREDWFPTTGSSDLVLLRIRIQIILNKVKRTGLLVLLDRQGRCKHRSGESQGVVNTVLLPAMAEFAARIRSFKFH